MPDLPYQNESQVEQALAERENAETYGQKTLIDAADKVLASFGITTKAERNRAAKRRQAHQAELDKAAEGRAEEKSKSDAPAGRSSGKKSTT